RWTLDLIKVLTIGVVCVALVALAAWQASSLRIGLIVCVGFAVLAVVLQGMGRLLIRVLRPLVNMPSFPLRHAVLHLSRPGNQTRVVLLAVGLGAFFIVGVRSLQASLLQEFSVGTEQSAPDMFLIDIQRDQVNGVRQLLSEPAHDAGPFKLL